MRMNTRPLILLAAALAAAALPACGPREQELEIVSQVVDDGAAKSVEVRRPDAFVRVERHATGCGQPARRSGLRMADCRAEN